MISFINCQAFLVDFKKMCINLNAHLIHLIKKLMYRSKQLFSKLILNCELIKKINKSSDHILFSSSIPSPSIFIFYVTFCGSGQNKTYIDGKSQKYSNERKSKLDKVEEELL